MISFKICNAILWCFSSYDIQIYLCGFLPAVLAYVSPSMGCKDAAGVFNGAAEDDD